MLTQQCHIPTYLTSCSFSIDTSYDYAVPELGTMPLLSQEPVIALPMVNSANSDKDSNFSKGSSSKSSKTEDTRGKKVSHIDTCAEIGAGGDGKLTKIESLNVVEV